MDYSSYTGQLPDRSWDNAFVADPHFYQRPDGTPFGAFALNEGSATILPKFPHKRYHPNGADLSEWRLLLYSKTLGDVLGDCDFFTTVKQLGLSGCVVDENDTHFLIRALSLNELRGLLQR